MEVNVEDVESLARLATEMGAEYSYDPKITAMETGEKAPVDLRMKAETLKRFYARPMKGYLAQT